MTPAPDQGPKPCPFCGLGLTRAEEGLNYRHPDNEKCFIGGRTIALTDLELWNTRGDAAPASKPAGEGKSDLFAMIVSDLADAATSIATVDWALTHGITLDPPVIRRWTERAMSAARRAKALELARVPEVAAVEPARMSEEPTEGELVSACLSYNHGYGLMNPEQRDKLHFQCREWWRSIARALERKEN